MIPYSVLIGNKSYVNAMGKLELSVVFIQSLVLPWRVTLKLIFKLITNIDYQKYLTYLTWITNDLIWKFYYDAFQEQLQ